MAEDSTELSHRRALIGRCLGAAIVLGAMATGAWTWHLNFVRPRTNDAMVRANIVGIAPEVSGRIVELRVEDNQKVKQGELLFVIDPRPYRARLAQARADLLKTEKEVEALQAATASAEARIGQLGHERDSAAAEIVRLQAEYDYQRQYLRRIEPLLAKNYVTADRVKEARSRRDAALAAVTQARAKEQASRKALTEAGRDHARAESLVAQFDGVNARVEAARAAVTAAELDVEYCYVKAPFDAYVTNLNTREGEFAKTGSEIFALVDDRHWYAIANFKETYLRSIRPGQETEVFLVGYPGKRFRGVVTGIGWANYPDNTKQQGVLPEVQRTLNWVILASRFPVRVEILDRDPAFPLRMGMTAFVTVRDLPADARP